MTTPRPPAPQPLTARPLSINSCSWDTLVAELGDPGLPEPPPATSTGTRPAVEPPTRPLRRVPAGATASGAGAAR